MKKGIFLGDAKSIQYVFPQDVCEALSGHCGLQGRVYTWDEVLAAPETFRDVLYIFSTL